MANQWWDQEGLNLVGIHTESKEAERMEGGEDTDGTYTDMD